MTRDIAVPSAEIENWRREPSYGEEIPRDKWQAIRRGIAGRCPACGKGKIFYRYLKVSDYCPHCHEALHHHRADDAPPYVTILITGHLVVGSILMTDSIWPNAPIWLHALIWPSVTLLISLWLLPIVKGGLIALQWALRMHGFATVDAKAPMLETFPPHL